MPKIKLLQNRGDYGWGDRNFLAGVEYEVDYQTAHYLIVDQKVAYEIIEKPTQEVQTAEEVIATPIPQEVQTAEEVITRPSEKLRIALIRIGGIGDTLILSALATAVKRKYPGCEISLFVRDKVGYDVVEDHPSVDHIVLCNNMRWETLLDKVIEQGFDIILDNRYVTRVIYKNLKRFLQDKNNTDLVFKAYEEFYDTFPLSNNRLSNAVKFSERELSLKTACLDGDDNDLFINLSPLDYTLTLLLENHPYITIHNGSDIGRQTKCWATKNWEAVVLHLKKKKYNMVQLGQKYEEPIEGAINLTGKTTIKQTAAILEKAKFHLDTESGLVHMARAVRTRSVVLFGPTPIHFFGYKENINIPSPSSCKECWWTNDMWWKECPRKFPTPVKCMNAIKVSQVCVAINKIEKMEPLPSIVKVVEEYDKNDINEQFAMELSLGEAHYKAERWQWDRVHTMMNLVKGKTILEVGAGDGYCVEVLTRQGYDVTAIEISKIRLKRMQDKGLKAQWGDIHNLPFSDNSFDTVICGEVLEHIPSMARGWAELERVCKPDGIIIVSLPVGAIHRQTKMHLWGISHHEILRQEKVDMIVLTMEQINRNG